MSDRRSKAETGEGAEQGSSHGPRRPSDPLHPSPPHHSYYSQQSAHVQYPPSNTREGISAYASYRARSGAPMPLHRGAVPYAHGPPPVNPRSSAHQVTPDSRQPPIPSEFMSPPSSVRRRYAQSPPPSSKSATKRPRRSGKFFLTRKSWGYLFAFSYCFGYTIVGMKFCGTACFL